jgi:hypothetical protein
VWCQEDLLLALCFPNLFPHDFLHPLLILRPQLLLIERHRPRCHWFWHHTCGDSELLWESKFNPLAEVGDSTVLEAEVRTTHCGFVFVSASRHLSLQSQLEHRQFASKHLHRLVWHVDTLVQLQRLSSCTGVDCGSLGERF